MRKLIDNGFNWTNWIDKEISIKLDRLADYRSTTCLMQRLFYNLVKRNKDEMYKDCSDISFFFRYSNPGSESKKVKLIVRRDGIVWFDVKVGAYATLGKVMLRVQLKLESYRLKSRSKQVLSVKNNDPLLELYIAA